MKKKKLAKATKLNANLNKNLKNILIYFITKVKQKSSSFYYENLNVN